MKKTTLIFIYCTLPLVFIAQTKYLSILEGSDTIFPALLFSEGSDIGMSMVYNGYVNGSGKRLMIYNIDELPAFTFESNGNMGIGLTSPNTKLHIIDGTDTKLTGGGFITLGENSSTNISFDDNEIMSRNNNNPSSLSLNAEGGNVLMNFGEDGRVGIGTNAPTAKFHVASGEVRFPASESMSTHFHYQVDEKNYIRGVTAFDMDNVGIGTNMPSTKLHITDGTESEPSSGGYLTLGSDNGLNLSMDNNEIMARNNGALSQLSLQVDGGEFNVHNSMNEDARFVVKADGSVGIGEADPAYPVEIKKNDPLWITRIINTHSSGGAGLLITLDGSTTLNKHFLTFRNGQNSNQGAIIGGSGNSVLYSTASDRRLKENIQPLRNALQLIQQIKPSTYQWKSTGDHDLGFIAQELYEVYPQAVNGHPLDDVEENPMGIDYAKLTPILTAAIQELMLRVEELEKEKCKSSH